MEWTNTTNPTEGICIQMPVAESGTKRISQKMGLPLVLPKDGVT